MRFFTTALTWWLWQPINEPVAYAQEIREVAAEAGSHFDVPHANALAIRSGDLLVRLTEVLEKSELDSTGQRVGVLKESETHCRVIFDHDRQQLLFAYRTELNITEFVPGELDETESHTFLDALFLDLPEKVMVFFESGGPPELRDLSRRPQDLEYARRWLGLADIRTLGIYPRGFRRSLSEIEKWLDERMSGHALIDYLRHPDGDPVVVYRAYQTEAGLIGRDWITFDTRTGMPVKIKRDSQIDEAMRKKLGVEYVGEFDEETRWEEHEGVFVPVRNICSYPESFVLRSGERIGGLAETVTEVHWFSVNQEIDEALCSSQSLADQKRIVKLLDPQLNRAFEFAPHKSKPTGRD